MDRADAAGRWTDQVSRLAAHEVYVDGDDAVSGYDATGSCLCGAPRPIPPLELVDPARRLSGSGLQPQT